MSECVQEMAVNIPVSIRVSKGKGVINNVQVRVGCLCWRNGIILHHAITIITDSI